MSYTALPAPDRAGDCGRTSAKHIAVIPSTPTHTIPPSCARPLCGQLAPRLGHPLAETVIARELSVHLVETVNHCRVIATPERLSDLEIGRASCRERVLLGV